MVFRSVRGHLKILKMVQACHRCSILWEQKCCQVGTSYCPAKGVVQSYTLLIIWIWRYKVSTSCIIWYSLVMYFGFGVLARGIMIFACFFYQLAMECAGSTASTVWIINCSCTKDNYGGKISFLLYYGTSYDSHCLGRIEPLWKFLIYLRKMQM